MITSLENRRYVRCGKMEWAVLDWSAQAVRLSRRIGARLGTEGIITRLKGAPLERLARSR